MPFEKYKKDFVLLLESGFIAVNQADEDASRKLFNAAAMLQPENTLPQVGFGYLHLHKLELTQAIQCFESVLKKEPQNDMAKALLGICMSLMPSHLTQGEKVLEETLHSKDPMIKSLSHTAINFVEKFVRPKPGPATEKKNT